MDKGFLKQFNAPWAFACGTLSAAIAIALGAFGSHGLRSVLTPEMLSTFETGVRYHIFHAFGLVATGLGGKFWAAENPRNFVLGAWCFGLGTLLFSGSLYALSLTGIVWLGLITPVGGTLFLAGWIFLFAAVLKECRTTA
jgi:uncharacterized membrane protein YgdD (TMEM256/DUF423 family)